MGQEEQKGSLPSWWPKEDAADAGESKPAATTHIGRETDNDVVLDDPATSRHHAEILFHEGHYVVKDLGSANGTYVNEQRVSERALADGDAIRVGQNVVKISLIA